MSTSLFTGSIVAIVTPFARTGDVDQAALARLLERQVKAGTRGVVIAGTTGEGASLSAASFEACMRAARTALAGTDVALIAGLGSPSTDKCLAQLVRAEDCGAQGLLCVTPYYLKTTQAGLVQHFETLADRASVPVILYNVPARTGVDLEPETTLELSRHSRIGAVKEALPDLDRMAWLAAETSADFAVLSGDDASACEAMCGGADGVISVSANLVPGAMANMTALITQGRHDEARALDHQLQPLHKALMAEPNPIPVKAALAQLGLIEGHLALPLVPAAAATKMALSQLMQNVPVQWTGAQEK